MPGQNPKVKKVNNGGTPPKKMKVSAKKGKPKGIVVHLADGNDAHIPANDVKRIKKMAKNVRCEEIVPMSVPNTVYLTSADFPVGADLNWQEVAESVLSAYIANTAVAPPIGAPAVKAYLWWFMIDRLRYVGGLYPEPNSSVVPSFPDNGNVPSGWAKFVEHLMPYVDKVTGTTYQFRYNYTYGAGLPATTSSVLNPSAPAGDFSFAAFGNFMLTPSPVPPAGSLNEMTWIFQNVPFSFQTDVVANNQNISQWFSASGNKTEARYVPLMAPDASSVAIPVAYNNNLKFSPGVYCQTNQFDPEMACILHPPVVTFPIVTTNFFNIIEFDWCAKPMPQVFNAGIVKVFAVGSNLVTTGQPELLLNYGYVTHNTHYIVGKKSKYLQSGQRLWPNLAAYAPYYYPLNNAGYHQSIQSVIQMLSVATKSVTPPPGTGIGPGYLTDAGDYMTCVAFFESIYLARTTEYAYVGLLLNTSDDVCSQTQFASAFRNCANNPVMADMLDVWAPTVRHGRLVVQYQDYRSIVSYGYSYNANLAAVNVNAARWIRIGDDFGSVNGNINDFALQLAGAYTGIADGPWVFNQQQVGGVTWNIRGPGQNIGSPNFGINVTSLNMGQTPNLPITYVLGNTVGPLAPCIYGPRIITKTMELFGPDGIGTWITVPYAKLGGYCTQSQVSAQIQPDATEQSTAQGAAVYIKMNFKLVSQSLGTYFRVDKESVGRCFAYSPRISTLNIADRYPTVQNLGGNSPVQDPLIENTQLGPGSNFNRAVQTKQEKMTGLSAVRSILGIMHINILPNFAADDLYAYQAFEMVLNTRKQVSMAPYHDEIGHSMFQMNSPDIFSQLISGLFDVGDRLVTTVGNTVGNLLGGGGGNILTSVFSDIAGGYIADRFPGIKMPKLPKQYNNMLIKVGAPPDSVVLKKNNVAACLSLSKKFASLSVKHSVADDKQSHDELVEQITMAVTKQLSKRVLSFES